MCSSGGALRRVADVPGRRRPTIGREDAPVPEASSVGGQGEWWLGWSLADRPRVGGARVVWLDPQPARNRAERQTFRELDVDVVAETDVDAAIGLVERNDPDVVITNYGAASSGGVADAVQVGKRVGSLAPVIVYSVGTA